ncbi:hypothetical protein [Wolbachia endosymbiont of Nilaparvata lugens]|uniref:hypothetical protein n=1 Tax=Wolbachia endosymbiont of Nilaparvata lugens TaxID=357143 RepID=UPI00117BFF3D|nr:hypothetical protein [Wolbachia endosymbiont of Nilaparvata lugens]
MSNYSEKEMSEMRDFDYKAINDLEVKIRPKNFEDIKDNPVSASYVNVIIEKFTNDFNQTLVPKLNNEFYLLIENLNRIQGEIVELETINHNNIDGWE